MLRWSDGELVEELIDADTGEELTGVLQPLCSWSVEGAARRAAWLKRRNGGGQSEETVAVRRSSAPVVRV